MPVDPVQLLQGNPEQQAGFLQLLRCAAGIVVVQVGLQLLDCHLQIVNLIADVSYLVHVFGGPMILVFVHCFSVFGCTEGTPVGV